MKYGTLKSLQSRNFSAQFNTFSSKLTYLIFVCNDTQFCYDTGCWFEFVSIQVLSKTSNFCSMLALLGSFGRKHSPFCDFRSFHSKIQQNLKNFELSKICLFSIAYYSGLSVSLKNFSISLKFRNLSSKMILSMNDKIFLLDFQIFLPFLSKTFEIFPPVFRKEGVWALSFSEGAKCTRILN